MEFDNSNFLNKSMPGRKISVMVTIVFGLLNQSSPRTDKSTRKSKSVEVGMVSTGNEWFLVQYAHSRSQSTSIKHV